MTKNDTLSAPKGGKFHRSGWVSSSARYPSSDPADETAGVRYPAVAGAFYPTGKSALEKMVERFLAEGRKSAPQIRGKIKVIIAPHAGYVYSGKVAGAAFSLLQNSKAKKILLIGPSHFEAFDGIALSPAKEWLTPLGPVPLLDSRKFEADGIAESDEAHLREHCLEVELPFLQKPLSGFSILPILTGNVRHKEVAEKISGILGSFDLVVASSDLSHYYDYETANRLDAIANKAIPGLDVKTDEERIEACGKTGILATMLLAKKFGWKGKFIAYNNSGDTAGNKAEVVGYGAYAFVEE